MFDPAPAPLVGVRRQDLPRSASGRAPMMPPEPGTAGLAASIDRHLAMGRRLRQPMAVLAVAVHGCRRLDGRPAPDLLHMLALEAGQRLRARVRGTDTVLWDSGPEFAVVMNDCHPDMAMGVRKRLLASLGEPYRLGPERAVATVAIGCACHPAAGDSGEQMLAAALAARGLLDRDG